MDNTKLITVLEQVKKTVTELKNISREMPQTDSYSVNSKTSYIYDKADALSDFVDDIMLDLM